MPESSPVPIRVKGQRLFVRPVEAADSAAIRAFFDREQPGAAFPACGLLGKLVGELVAVVEMDIAQGAIRIDNIVVARELRRKRIGRVMLAEVEQIAARMDCGRLIAAEGPGDGFFSRAGFEREGAWWIRQVKSEVQRVSR